MKNKGTWQSGVCGGGNNRRCCVKAEPIPELQRGDYYWNTHTGYALSQTLNYSYSSLKAAQEECIKLGDRCQGITLR